MATEIEQRALSRTVVSSTAVPAYDHVPLVSDAENERFSLTYVCAPGMGVLRSPAIDAVIVSDGSLPRALRRSAAQQ